MAPETGSVHTGPLILEMSREIRGITGQFELDDPARLGIIITNDSAANRSYAFCLSAIGRMTSVAVDKIRCYSEDEASQFIVEEGHRYNGLIPMLPSGTAAGEQAVIGALTPHNDVDSLNHDDETPATSIAELMVAKLLTGREISGFGRVILLGYGERTNMGVDRLLVDEGKSDHIVLATVNEITSGIAKGALKGADLIFSAVPVGHIIRDVSENTVIVDAGFGLIDGSDKYGPNVHPDVLQIAGVKVSDFRAGVGPVSALTLHKRTALRKVDQLIAA